MYIAMKYFSASDVRPPYKVTGDASFGQNWWPVLNSQHALQSLRHPNVWEQAEG